MSATKNICAICAWRANCQKKFSVSGKDLRCPDFVKDISLSEEKDEKEKDSEIKKGEKNT
ncbi:MAG: hypothetical protein AAB012_04725 [Nitrospirota bacterium]